MRKTIGNLTALSVATAMGLLAFMARGESIEELKAMIRELDQKVRVLERNQELEKETAADKSKSAPLITAGANAFSPGRTCSLPSESIRLSSFRIATLACKFKAIFSRAG